MDGISLDQVALQQLYGEQKALLDTIDDLRKHGVGRIVDLPQIIVVGDQSSGKSSVLEAISRARFPVKDGLCTRFATELVLRTDSQPKVDVCIQPASPSVNGLYSFNETSFDKDDLPEIIETAKTQMLKSSATFSEDVLRVEICGPDIPHLTLVDLPGFYHSEDENQSAAGREIVGRLVERYMAKRNSIILAIISARNQVILQKVLSKVKLHDKNKNWTLGIITKPDLLVSGSQDEENFVRLAKNLDRSHELLLGWHVLRNRGEAELLDTHEERDQKEYDFLESGLWSTIPSKNRGIATLRSKLSTILLEHIRNNLQGLIEAIEEQIDNRQNQLKALGEPRLTPRELRAYLDRIASQFQKLSLHAVEGNYSDNFFGGLYPEGGTSSIDDGRIKKLRALVRDLNRAFAYVLATKGSKRIIMKDEDDEDKQHNSNRGLPSYLHNLAAQYRFDDPQKVAFESIAADLESLSSANQGNEFPGTANDRLAVKLFRDQCQPWEAISRFHLQLILRTTMAFIEKLVGYIAGPDTRTSTAILSEIVDPFFEEKAVILEAKLQELLSHFRSGYPQPIDAEFRALLASRRRKTLTTEVVRDLLENRPELFTEEARYTLSKISASKLTGEFGVEGLIDKSETYYELSLRTFTENMVVLAIENCLIRDLPLIFTTETVNQMEDSELERLASESPGIRQERTEIRAEHDILKKGLQLCKKFKARNSTIVPSALFEMGSIPSMQASVWQTSKSSSEHTPSTKPEKDTGPINVVKVDTKASLFSNGSSPGLFGGPPSNSKGLFGSVGSVPANPFGTNSLNQSVAPFSGFASSYATRKSTPYGDKESSYSTTTVPSGSPFGSSALPSGGIFGQSTSKKCKCKI
ncbi:P-loop containing nucleoside triphosphate hydrolase protein [Biscogniauxia marginata]|nr:P-loop containing nucleoside triphosphate hydrolase protein [Biscogniauxia marginata]